MPNVLQIDPHQKKRNFRLPSLFERVSGLNNPEAHKHAVPRLDCEELIDLHGQLMNFVDAVCTSTLQSAIQ